MISLLRLGPPLIAALLTTVLTCGCREAAPPIGEDADSSPRVVRLATTTSTDNSGLLKELLPRFTARSGVEVHVIAVGTGKAIRHGERGEVDLVMVHAREAEERFVSQGHGVNRRPLMHNDFVLVGPRVDPAGIRGGTDAAAALAAIAKADARFLSRADESGTHKKEQQLWHHAQVEPGGAWYVRAGQGMGAVLTMADQMEAYTLTDRGTWLAMQGKLSLEVLIEGDPRLHNPYGLIAVNPARHRHANYVDAMTLIGYLTSQEGQAAIASFRKGEEQLFHPDAVPEAQGER